MSNPVVHFEVVGKDAKALQNFYSDAFGWRMEPSTPTDVPGGPSIAMFTDPEGHLVGLLEAGTSDPAPH